MITSLRANEIDVAIGLTEGWVAGLGKEGEKAGYKIVGTYVETPLCWAISTGKEKEWNDVEDLKEGKIGVSRIGRYVTGSTVADRERVLRNCSGSYVMGFVLADTKRWLKAPGDIPFDVVPLQTFAKLREAVNDGTADFFMWEHFTSKRYYDNGEIKRIGEIYTPWSSWKIVARDAEDERLPELFAKINHGVKYFEEHQEEAVEYISTHLDYSKEDAQEWLQTVKFAPDVKGVSHETIAKTIEILRKAGVIDGASIQTSDMIGFSRSN